MPVYGPNSGAKRVITELSDLGCVRRTYSDWVAYMGVIPVERKARISVVFALVAPIAMVDPAHAQLPPPRITLGGNGLDSGGISIIDFDCLGPTSRSIQPGCPLPPLSCDTPCGTHPGNISATASLETSPAIGCGPTLSGAVSQVHAQMTLKMELADLCQSGLQGRMAFFIRNEESCPLNFTVSLNKGLIQPEGDIRITNSLLQIRESGAEAGMYCRGTNCFQGDQNSLVTVGTLSREPGSFPLAFDITADVVGGSGGPGHSGSVTVDLDLTINLVTGSDCAQSASSMHWINPAGGSWSTDTNWDPQQVPVRDAGHADTAIFDLATPFYSVDFTPGATADRMRVRNSFVEFFGSLMQLFSFDSDNPSLSIGGNSQLQLTGGTIKCVDANIGDIDGSTGILSLAADPDSNLTASGTISVGVRGNGSLDVGAGTLKCDKLLLVGTGTTDAVFEGPTAHGDIRSMGVGTEGPATLTIERGAAVSGDFAAVGADFPGSVIVNGTSSEGQLSAWSVRDLEVGFNATGTLEILDGGSVIDTETDAQAVIAFDGSVRVSGTPGGGPASQLTTRHLQVGLLGPQVHTGGSLTVEQQGRVECDDLVIAALQSPTSVTVETGGELKVNNELQLGSDDQPIGQVEPAQLRVSDSPGTDHVALTTEGLARLNGPNSLLNLSGEGQANFNKGLEVLPTRFAQVVAVGANTVAVVSDHMTVAGKNADAVASVVVQNGAAIVQPAKFGFSNPVPLQVGLSAEEPGDILIVHPLAGFNAPPRAQMHFDRVDIERGRIRVEEAGLLSVDNNLVVRDGGRLEVASTLLPVANAPNVKCNQLVINSGGVVRCCPGGSVVATSILGQVGARIEGAPNVTGNVLTGGLVQVGCSPGTMTIQGNFEQSAEGALVVQAAGLEPGQLDLLRITGTATLGGTLKVLFQNGFLPRRGNAFPFIQADEGITGGFGAVSFPQLAPGFNVNFSTAGGGLVMTALNDAVRAQVGDFDHDGDVDLDDFVQFELCSTGPTLGTPGVDCDFADFDGDSDVDEGDFDLFQRCFSGANVAAHSDCANR